MRKSLIGTKQILPILILLASCGKDSSFQNSRPVTLANSTLLVNGSLDLQTDNANIASLGIINYRSSYELCGTSGDNLFWPVVLPLIDSAVFPASILADGDSLSAEVELDTTYKKYYNITMIVKENNIIVNNLSVFSQSSLKRKFVFHNGSSYDFSATVQ
jgi:hypothetical protein